MANYDDTATVSGSVVSFLDGADEVGLKSCVVSLSASLSGYSEVNGTQTRKNLLDVSTAQGTGTIWFYYDNGIKLKKGATYTFSCGNYGSGSISFYGLDHTTQIAYAYISASSAKVTYTPTEDVIVCPRIYQSGLTVSGLVDVMLEVGSTATAYEAYEAPTQYTASLGRTIYGGQADIVSGQGIEEREKVEFDGSDDENWSLVATGTYRYSFLSQNFIKTNTMYTDILCDTIEVKNTSENVDGGITCRGTSYSSRRFYIFFPISNSEGVNDLTTFKAWLSNNPCNIVYAPTTPTDFTFDPVTIETNKGSNTFWSDQGNTELTYYKDGYGFTSVTVHKETPEGEPVEETRKLHRIIYEGQVDVISGTGLIYRGESGTQYDPPEQISFTPIEIATDEGENTLFADEGDSAITYRKAVD